MEGKTLEELREDLISTLESYAIQMGSGGTLAEIRKAAEDKVYDFEDAVQTEEHDNG